MRKPLVAGNWKMNGSIALAVEFNEKLAATRAGSEIVLCPPSTLFHCFTRSNVTIGAQNVSHFDDGAHTGDLSVDMLNEAGCKYVIIGHSERREAHGESSALVAQKAKKCVGKGITPIICVGETLDVRLAGNVESFIAEQLAPIIDSLTIEELHQIVIAYEPIWAIGTGKTATPEQAQEVHSFIRTYIGAASEDVAQQLQILYGGSVKPDNAETLFAQLDIDGGLIGGASLKVEDFISICRAAD